MELETAIRKVLGELGTEEASAAADTLCAFLKDGPAHVEEGLRAQVRTIVTTAIGRTLADIILDGVLFTSICPGDSWERGEEPSFTLLGHAPGETALSIRGTPEGQCSATVGAFELAPELARFLYEGASRELFKRTVNALIGVRDGQTFEAAAEATGVTADWLRTAQARLG